MKARIICLSAVVAGSIALSGCGEKVQSADLDRVLDVTVDTLYQMKGLSEETPEAEALTTLESTLEKNYNRAQPQVHPNPIGVDIKEDGSFLGFDDKNQDGAQDEGEAKLFTVEIDGENNRLIATDINETIRDHGFSGTGLLAGFLLGSLLNKQRAAGANPSNKKAMSKSAYQNARSRAGSGSHTKGK